MKKNLIAGAILTTTCFGAIVFAQDTKTDDTKSPPVFAAPLRTYNVTPSELNKDKFDINAAMAPVVPILESIAEQGGLKLVISDELKAQNPHIFVKLRQISARDAIEHIAQEHGLAWGKVGAETYLIVTQKLNTRISTITAAPSAQEFLKQHEFDKSDKPTPDAQPFDFNGQRYYRVPLQGAQKAR